MKVTPNANHKLLVVDDDRSNCDLVAKLLIDRGYQVDVATDGPAALKLLENNSYVLAVLDYQMPGMNGVELFRKAREVQPNLLGVFLTAFARIDTVFPAINAGVERVLAKPANAQELVPLIDELTSLAH